MGHDIPSLTLNRTLKSLYIDPLVKILEGQNPSLMFGDEEREGERKNGVFDTEPAQTLVLLIDFKTEGRMTWPFVRDALAPLREKGYLTYQNGSTKVEGPITVVGTGNTPFDLVTSDTANPHKDIYFDAPLGDMWEDESPASKPSTTSTSSNSTDVSAISTDSYTYNPSNSFYASTPFHKSIGYVPTGKLSKRQMSILRRQIRGAHRRGLKARYWDLPFWPIGLRNTIWQILVEEGVDLLNVDDLKSATQRDWGNWKGWWYVHSGVIFFPLQ